MPSPPPAERKASRQEPGESIRETEPKAPTERRKSTRGDAPATIEKKVYRFDLAGATDRTGLPETFTVVRDGAAAPLTADQMTPGELAAAGVHPLEKTLQVDLNAVGYNGVEKVEGLAVLDRETVAVINDNDFTVGNITVDTATGTFTRNSPGDKTVLGIVHTGGPVGSALGGSPTPAAARFLKRLGLFREFFAD